MASKRSTVGQFIQSAPPGELSEIVSDVKSLTADDPQALSSQGDAFKRHNEAQYEVVELPSVSGRKVLISPFNGLSGGRYYDTASAKAFGFDHITQRASNVQDHHVESSHGELLKTLSSTFDKQAAEHFPTFATGVFPTDNDSQIALVLVANKYSPNNFWNGRWRSSYRFDTASSTLTGTIQVDVHYYEDGNVRLLTEKPVSSSLGGASAMEIVRQIAMLEKRYQEDLNRAFTNLSEGVFKSLRRQLPVTRQKIEWEKISGYRGKILGEAEEGDVTEDG